VPAQALETVVVQTIVQHLQDHADRHAVLDVCDATTSTAAATAITDLAVRVTSAGIQFASSLILAATLGHGRLNLTLDRSALARAAQLGADDLNPNLCILDVPFTCRRRGVENKIIAGPRVAAPYRTLIRALRNAHAWSEAFKSGLPLCQIAVRAGHSERYIARVITMISLSPKIQTAILDGTQPVDLSLEHMMQNPIPLGWSEQEQRYRIGA
jgi:site-specific DNA recombinase